jgi:hypothetical protein
MTKCKFKCDFITKRTNYNDRESFIYDYHFSPVIDGSEENKTFWKYTPSGKLELGCIHQDLFEVGKEYYLDIYSAI